jgi:hypothetical protein
MMLPPSFPLPIPELKYLVRSLLPYDWTNVRHARCSWAGTLVRVNACYRTGIKPNESVIVVAEACTGLTVRPCLAASLNVSIVRRSHDFQYMLFVIAHSN